MRISLFDTLMIAVGCAVVVAIGAIAWREATETEYGEVLTYSRDMLITADYVSHCQTMTDDCYAAADTAMDWALAHDRVTEECLSHRPGRRVMARGALIWLNAHVELHPLTVEEGITRAADAIWPCDKK